MARSALRRAAALLKRLQEVGGGLRVQLAPKPVLLSTAPVYAPGFAPLRSSPSLGFLAAAGGLAALGLLQQTYNPTVAFAEPAQPPSLAPATAEVDETAVYRRSKQRHGLPKEIILYQYEVCPFCNKVRAFLDYHKVPYRTVEVNPLTKKELKWSGHKKVPVALLDKDVVNDSSAILSRLSAEFEPARPSTSRKGWFSKATEAAGMTEAEVAEEIKWRQWVDKRFVQLLTVNIYRTLRESWQTFNYIAEHGNFNFAERQAARVAGSGLMYGISGRLIKKYGIQGDLRQALYAGADEWAQGIPAGQRFMGGGTPNLADLSMFGVIRSVTGTDTFMDLMHQTKIAPWYEAMMAAVGESSRLPG